MNKLFLLIICIGLSNCELKPREETAQAPEYLWDGRKATAETFMYDGIEYVVVHKSASAPSGGVAIFVINHTKEKLEIATLKKELR